jgi:hypothetical protein
MSETPSGENTHKPVRTDKRHVDCGAKLYHVGSDRMLFCPRCQKRVYCDTPPHEVSDE